MFINKMKEKLNKMIPKFAVFPLICVIILQFLVYLGTKAITQNSVHVYPMLPIDNYIPFIPWFIYIYVGCYIHWYVTYVLVAHTSKSHFLRFMNAVAISYIICGIIYLAMPTTIDRPYIGNIGRIAGFLLTTIYSADTPVNLFPSMHCLISWLCWIGMRRQKKIPLWYRVFTFVLGILVCVSTVTVKQHFFIDIVAGILVAEVSWFISRFIHKKKELSV